MKNFNFAERLIVWQRRHGRHDLPWQGTRDAYRVWLSEIMLQQTQVTTVIPYYRRFLECFPTVAALAGAQISAVLELWAGLGYYARARNLHRCAQTIVAEHGGGFPATPQGLAELPGIGRSTAAAISVFAFGNRAAILDGNVKRVLARCFGIEGFPGEARTEREMWTLAESLLPVAKVEAYTQGLMDLGAMLCTRRKPSCGRCPMLGNCVAQRDGRQHELPASRPAKKLPEREAALILITDGERVLVERRPPTGIWGGLLVLPECPVDAAQMFAQSLGCRVIKINPLPALRHVFTHFRLDLKPLLCCVEMTEASVTDLGFEWLRLGDVAQAALPTPVRKIITSLANKV